MQLHWQKTKQHVTEKQTVKKILDSEYKNIDHDK